MGIDADVGQILAQLRIPACQQFTLDLFAFSYEVKIVFAMRTVLAGHKKENKERTEGR